MKKLPDFPEGNDGEKDEFKIPTGEDFLHYDVDFSRGMTYNKTINVFDNELFGDLYFANGVNF